MLFVCLDEGELAARSFMCVFCCLSLLFVGRVVFTFFLCAFVVFVCSLLERKRRHSGMGVCWFPVFVCCLFCLLPTICYLFCLLPVICFVCRHCCWRDSRSLKMSVVCLFLVLFSYVCLFICLF